jgi:uncharacterized repeat protein (TIGR01451 family)
MNIKRLLISSTLGIGGLMVLWSIITLLSFSEAHAAGLDSPLRPTSCLPSGISCWSSEAAIGRATGAYAPLLATVTTTLPANKDNTLYEKLDGSLSNGQGQHFFVGRTGTNPPNQLQIRRGLIAFDLAGSSIPANAIIMSVTLTLHVSQLPNEGDPFQTISLHRLSANWGEGASNALGEEGSGAASASGDATWLHRSYTNTLWATAGGDFVPASSASRTVDNIGFFSWSSPQMVNDVQFWLNTPGQNFGWLLRGNEVVSKTARRFDTRENPTTNNRPVLIVEYSLPQAELALTKTVSDLTPGAVENVTYTIVVSNPGNAPATNVRIFDQEPNGINFNTASIIVTPPGGVTSTTGSQIAISGLTLGPGQRVTTTFRAAIGNNEDTGTLITNTATVTSAEIATPVGASVTLTVTNLAISKTASNPNPAPGEVVTFTIVVTNIANRTFNPVTVGDILPSGLEFEQLVNLPNITEGFSNNTVLATTTNALDPAETMMVIFSATISENLSAGDIITNTAGVISNIDNNPSLTSTVLVLSPPAPPNLALSKQINTSTAKPGQRITYTVVVTNSGQGPATTARISDTLPSGVTFAGPISLTPAGAGTAGNGGTLPTLASNLRINAGTTITITFPVTVNLGLAGGTIVNNTADITSSETVIPVSGSAAFTVVLPDLTLDKQVDDVTPEAGQRITYTVVVVNNGPVSAENALISDVLPSQVTFAGPINLVPAGAGTVGNAGTLPTLASSLTLTPGATITVTFPVTVNVGTPVNTIVNNTASITSNETPNPTSDTASFTVAPPDLTLEKQVDKPQAVPGSDLIYTIIVTNSGQGFATGGTLIDFLPSQVDFVGPLSLDPPGAGTVGAPPFLVTNLTITPGTRIVVTMPVQVRSDTPFNTILNNTASINSNGTVRSDSAIVTITPALLQLVKQISNPRPLPGTVVTYTILVTNVGQVAHFNLTISDTIPNGLTLLPPITLDSPSSGSVGSPPQIAQVNSLFPGQSLKITFQTLVSSGLTAGTQIANRAEVNSNELLNPILGSVGLVVGAPSMTLTKQIDTPFPIAGQTVTYTIRLTNDGDATMTNVVISDILPGGLTFVGPVALDPAGAGITGSPPLLATLPNLAPGERVTVTLPVQVNSALAQGTIITNTATVNSLLPLLSVQDSVILTVATPGLTLTKQINNPRPIAGQPVTYTLRLTNTGNALLTDLVVSDTLPPGLTLAGSITIDPPGAGTNGTLPTVATIPTLTAGSSLTITLPAALNAAVLSGTTLTNTATVTTNFPPLLAGDSVTLTVATPGLTLTKQVDTPTPPAGQFINYTIILTNTGDAFLTNLIISDTLPAGLTLAGSITLNPPGAGTTGTLPTLATIPSLAPGSSLTLNLPVQVSSAISTGTVITNTAVVTSAETVIPVTDAVTVTITPPPTVGLDILKQVNKTNPQAGEIITYTLVVVNIGQTPATNIHVSDTLPGGVTFLGPVTLTPPGTLITPTLPTLASGLTLASGDRLTLTFPIRVNPGIIAGTILTNTASVTSAQVATPTTSAVTAIVIPSPTPASVLTKQVSHPTPQAGSIVTYTLLVTNTSQVNATGMRISDTLPAGLTFIGPISLNPPGTGTPGNAGTLPTLASSVVLSAGRRLTLTFPVRVNQNVVSGTLITNRASVTSTQVATPTSGQVTLRVITLTTPAPGRLFLPLILKTLPIFPDLVGSFTLTPNQTNFAAGTPVIITVVVTNVGAAAADSFWVDFYINPAVTPGVNIPWNQACSLSPCYGIAWFVPPGLDPGESVTLTSTPASYATLQTIWPGSFASGTSDLYLYVDSWNPTVDAGGVFESNESNNGAERHGFTVTGLGASSAELPDPSQLPPRPAP